MDTVSLVCLSLFPNEVSLSLSLVCLSLVSLSHSSSRQTETAAGAEPPRCGIHMPTLLLCSYASLDHACTWYPHVRVGTYSCTLDLAS